VLRNNIAFATRGQNELAIRLAVHDHNLQNGVAWDAFNPPIRLDATAFESLDDSIARGPRQPDGSLPISGFLRPKVGSVLIGRGSTQSLFE
jgi:pectate disaccharide-lyase